MRNNLLNDKNPYRTPKQEVLPYEVTTAATGAGNETAVMFMWVYLLPVIECILRILEIVSRVKGFLRKTNKKFIRKRRTFM